MDPDERSAPIALLCAACMIATLPAVAGSLTDQPRAARFSRTGDATGLGPPVDVDRVQRIDAPGDYHLSLEHQGQTRLYRVHVPPSYSPGTPTAVVLSLHGGGGNYHYQADNEYYGMLAKADAAGFVAVFPNGYSRFPNGRLATWNAGSCCAAARDRNIDDVGFIRAMLARLRTQLNIDPGRIYANGISNGGMMSYRLACEMAETFGAIASVAGTDGTADCRPTRPVSILHIHALDDDVVLFGGGAGPRSRQLADFTPVPETIAHWVDLNGCNPAPQRTLELPTAYCDTYAGCRGDARVRLCVTQNGGHSWPGGRKVRTGEPGSTAFSATDLIWDFYQGH